MTRALDAKARTAVRHETTSKDPGLRLCLVPWALPNVPRLGWRMNRHEEGAFSDPVLAGNPVYDPDGRRYSQTSFKGHRAATLGLANMAS